MAAVPVGQHGWRSLSQSDQTAQSQSADPRAEVKDKKQANAHFHKHTAMMKFVSAVQTKRAVLSHPLLSDQASTADIWF